MTQEEMQARAEAMIEAERHSWADYWLRYHDHPNPILRTQSPSPEALFERVCSPAAPRNGHRLPRWSGATARVRFLRHLLGLLRTANDPKVRDGAWAAIEFLLRDFDEKCLANRNAKRARRLAIKVEERPDPRPCGNPNCNGQIPPTAHGRMRFCSTRCRVAAHRHVAKMPC